MCKPWGKRGDNYNALKQRLTERLLEHLYDNLPQLQGKNTSTQSPGNPAISASSNA
jgi:hypothetical protein